MTTTPEPRRFSMPLPRPLWIGVATVVLVVAAVGIQLGVQIHRQQVAIREIERAGDEVTVIPMGPKWLARFVGDDWLDACGRVASVEMTGRTELPDGFFNDLRCFRSVEQLDLTNSHVTDADLKYVEQLASLRGLVLTGTRVTGSGMQQLTGLGKLEWLSLVNTQITDTGIEKLTGLTELKELAVDLTDVTDGALVHLEKLPRLHYLYAHDTSVTEEGVSKLKRAIPNLEVYWQRW